MINKLLISAAFLMWASFSFAQTTKVSGKVTDNSTQESLIGVNISYAAGKGVVTDLDGNFSIDLPYGDYTFIFSYVGYQVVEKKVTLSKPTYSFNISLNNKTLKEVEIIADVAKARETPVAFSTVQPKQLEEELASRDLPMILNSTPGVYATQQGGGDGDARINIRGFNQRNIAVMLDGIPVNDMENGWVYWSNWFGLDVVTRSIQVQRGLGASKLALPSVGGTMNIITKGIETKKGLQLKQEVGNDGFTRTSLGITTGQMKNGWGVTFAGSYKQGNGWVDQTWTKGYFYYLRVDKKLGDHLISFSTMGAPQSHGQRSYTQHMYVFDTEYASKQGIDPKDYLSGSPTDLGLKYNSYWGNLTRTAEGETEPTKLNTAQNFYYKPMYSLRDYWYISPKTYMTNIVYVSMGDGGGTGLTHTFSPLPDGTTNLQQPIYNANVLGAANNKATSNILRASMNNHFWVGFLNTTDHDISKSWKLSGGVDLRYYKGEHYRTAYDMLGATLYNDRTLINGAKIPNDKTNPIYNKEEGDIILYHNDGLVTWGGIFGQATYKEGNWSAFINLSTAYTGYKRVDYFKNNDLVIDGTVYEQAVGYSVLQYDPAINDFNYLPDTFMVNGLPYTINSPEARTAQTDWKWIPSFTVKGGANYNFTETQNVFVNVGYLNKAPRFANVYDNNNRMYRDIKNEKIAAFELGYSYFNNKMSFNLNTYVTSWQNKPADRAFTFKDADEVVYSVNINGMDALHMGIEAEIGYRITKGLLSETVIAVGNWKWLSSDSAIVTDQNTGAEVGKVFFDARGLKVGDAAQTQLRESLRWELPRHTVNWSQSRNMLQWTGLILKSAVPTYIKGAVTYFGDNYSQFDPLTLDPAKFPNSFDDNGNPIQSWKIPNYYTVDIFAGYYFKVKNSRFNLSFSILNILDKEYVADAQNNDQYSGQNFNSSDARSATVFFGMGRTFMTSLAVKF